MKDELDRVIQRENEERERRIALIRAKQRTHTLEVEEREAPAKLIQKWRESADYYEKQIREDLYLSPSSCAEYQLAADTLRECASDLEEVTNA